jgi:hypothetical protein
MLATKAVADAGPTPGSRPRSRTHQVSSNITDVQRGAAETGTASSQVLSAAQMLANDLSRLKTEVSKFLTNVRAAQALGGKCRPSGRSHQERAAGFTGKCKPYSASCHSLTAGGLVADRVDDMVSDPAAFTVSAIFPAR